ncbi:MAG: metallophosphoesterase family protein [Chthoniobacterales bacterium]|jgi:putative phosphoesterase
MRIAVLADTHNRLPPAVGAAVAVADEIWHLGDICSPAILAELRRLGPPLHVIRGNCDPASIAPASLCLERAGHHFYLIHEPPLAVPAAARFALHGHTHVPRDETIEGVRYLNPGSIGKPNHGAPASFAWLDVGDDGGVHWSVVPTA